MQAASHKFLRKFLNFWPPLLFAGIRMRHASPDFRRVTVELKLRWWNRNAAGTQFGGSLFAMTDPFYPLMLSANLGPDYIIWDKAAEIDYLTPGRGTVQAEFELTDAKLAEILKATAHGEKYLPAFDVKITDRQGQIVARVRRIVYVRRKPATAAKIKQPVPDPAGMAG